MCTKRKTLCYGGPSRLQNMFAADASEQDKPPLDKDGNYFLDYDPGLFGLLLNVLRFISTGSKRVEAPEDQLSNLCELSRRLGFPYNGAVRRANDCQWH